MSGKFITFEGIDGSGKSTQLRLLSDDLQIRGFDILTTLQPGGTPLGRRLRSVFLETEEEVAPMAELLLFAADRAQHVELLIKPSLKENKIVISDRYADATVAYQGAGRGFSPAIISQVIELATGGLKPDLTLFFDLTVEEALLRTQKRDEMGQKRNRLDNENYGFHQRVRNAYHEMIAQEPDRFRVIDASKSMEEIRQNALEVLLNFLNS